MSRLPFTVLLNTSTLGRYSVLDLQANISKEITFQVSISGSPTFSVDLEGSLNSADPASPWTTLSTVTVPGFYTVSTHWVRYLGANLKTFSGSGTVSVVVAPAQY